MSFDGLFVHGVCNPSADSALAAFSSQFPYSDSANLYALYSASFTVPNSIDATIKIFSLASSQINTLTYSVPLVACDLDLPPVWLAQFDPNVAANFFAWGFGGIMFIGMMSWGIGSIVRFTHEILTKPKGD